MDNGITVEFDAMGADILTEKLATALSTGNAPALTFQFNLQVGTHGKNDTMRDLSDFWEKTGVDKDDFMEESITACSTMESRSCFLSTGIPLTCTGTRICLRPPA